MPNASRGFTILELTLVIAISAALMTVIYAMSEQLTRLDSRLKDERYQLTRGAMERHWVTSIVEGLATEFPGRTDSARLFRGTEQAFSGFTTGSLGDRPGAPKAFSLSIVTRTEGDALTTQLVYREQAAGDNNSRGLARSDSAIVLAELPGRLKIRFVDQGGKPSVVWPAPISASPARGPDSVGGLLGALGIAVPTPSAPKAQLPAWIEFVQPQSDGKEKIWMVARPVMTEVPERGLFGF
jgi:prepilin-type N-terminal cleavage/methylation domain-containing protein